MDDSAADRAAQENELVSLEAALDEAVDDGRDEAYLRSLRLQIAHAQAKLARN